MAYAPTTDQILDLDGVYCRADSFEYDLLDKTEQVIGSLHPDADRPPVVTVNTAGQETRTLTSFNLFPPEATDVNTLSDRVRVRMVLSNSESFTLGVFMWANDSRPFQQWGTTRFSSLVDKMLVLNKKTEHSISFGKGADVGLAVLGVVLEVAELSDIVIDTITADFGAPLAYPPLTVRSQILKDMMALIGFLPPHCDRDGKYRFVDTPDLTTVTPVIPPYEDGTRIIENSLVDSDDGLDAPNVFVVYDSSGQSPVTGIYEVNASAPQSEANRGFRAPEGESRSGLGTTARANRAAQALATTNPKTFRWFNWAGTADPRHDIWDPLTLNGETVMETGHSMACISGAPHSHTARTVY